jgi:hypothetical protein
MIRKSALAFTLAAAPAFVSADVCKIVGMSPYYIGEGKFAQLEPAFEDYAFMLDDACAAWGFTAHDECGIVTLMGDVGLNAIATYCDGTPVIIYNRQLSGIVGGDGAEFVIAHELGHHVCHHLDEPTGDLAAIRAEELEADRFAGATLQKMGKTRDHALEISNIFPEEASETHPSKILREMAIRAGWENPDAALACRGRGQGDK